MGRIVSPAPREIERGGRTPPAAARADAREVVFETDGEATACTAAHYERTRLLAGNLIEGPAVVSQLDATTVIPPGAQAEVDRYGNLVASISLVGRHSPGCVPSEDDHG